MKDSYTMNIAGLTRTLPLCPISEELYIGAFIILGDQELSAAAARELLKRAPAYDYLITAECKGIPLAHEIARQAGDARYFVARKGEKLYMKDPLKITVDSITTAKQQMLYLDGADAELMRGKRILIVDDVISTGESLRSIASLVEAAGGKVVGNMCILAEGDAWKRDDIIYLEKLPLFDREGNPIV